jgi:hypothetical protein
VAIEESLNLDLGPALASIRGELTREIEGIPNTLRDSFGTALQGMATDVGAFAELAKEEVDRVLGAPVATTVEVDTSEVTDAAGAIADAGQPIEAPVEVDTSEIDAASADIADASGEAIGASVVVDTSDLDAAKTEIEDLDGETVTVAVEADTSGLAGAQSEIEEIGAGGAAARGAIEGLGGAIGGASLGAGKLSGTLEQLGGAGFAIPAGVAAGIGLFASEAIHADEVTRSFNLRVGDLAETLNRVDVAGLNTSLSDLAIKVGADDEGLRLAIARFVSLSDGSGRAREEVGKMGQELVALSANLSVTNPALGTADEILNALPAALARGGRALTPFGIAINSAAIQSRALTDSGKDTAAELTIFDKAAAGLALTMEKLGPSLKTGLEEGAATAAIQLRSLKTELKETIEAGGQPLIEPVVEALKAAQPILLAAAQGVGKLGQGVGDVLVPALAVAAPIVKGLSDALDAIPEPLIEGAAAAALAYKAYAPLSAGLSAVRAASAALPAIFSSSVGPLAALTIAEEAQAAAAAADATAQEALAVAEAELVIAGTGSTAAIVGLGVAQANAVGTAVALAAAEEEVAVAAEEATVALGPIAVAAAAAAAVIFTVTRRSNELKVSVTDLAKATDEQLVAAFRKLQAIGLGDQFFKETAEGSEDVAVRLRNALQDAGENVDSYTAQLQAMDAQQAEVAESTARVGEEVARTDAYVSPAVHNLQEYVSAQGAAADTAEALAHQQERLQATLDANTEALVAEAKAADEAAQGFRDSLSALNALIGVTFDATTQDLDFAITLDKMKAKQDELVKSKGVLAAGYKLETAAGRENIAALVAQVKSQADLISKNIDAGETVKQATDRYQKQVDALGKVAAGAGLTKTQYDGLLASYGLTPTEVATKITLAGVPEAKAAADDVKSYIEKLDPKLRAKLTLDEVAFFEALERVKSQIKSAGPGVDAGFAAEFAASQIPVQKAYGGIVYNPKHAAGGGAAAGIATATTGPIIFNEPETQGEAFIPFALDRRDRATKTLGAVADQFGFALTKKGDRESLQVPSGSAIAESGAGSGGGGVAVLERIASLLDALPAKIPAGVNANVTLTTQEADVLGQLADRLRGH